MKRIQSGVLGFVLAFRTSGSFAQTDTKSAGEDIEEAERRLKSSEKDRQRGQEGLEEGCKQGSRKNRGWRSRGKRRDAALGKTSTLS